MKPDHLVVIDPCNIGTQIMSVFWRQCVVNKNHLALRGIINKVKRLAHFFFLTVFSNGRRYDANHLII